MAIIDSKKVDYLWKKIGYGSAKTDTNANKKAPNEAISSPLLLNGTNTWNRADQIPGTQPASSAGVVTVYPTSNPIECTEDNTATQYRTWKTGQTDWIPPEFGSTYQAKVYIHTSSDAAGATGGTQVFATGSGNDDEWFFDYQAGILHFIGTNLPNGVSFSGKSVYIAASRYTGTKGLESIYSYIDSQVSASGTLTIADDGSTTSAVELDNTVQFLGGNNISTTVSGATITFTGATDINVNSITSTDSSAIQINDGLNVAGATTVNNTLNVTGAATLGTSLTLPTGATVTAILDEDTMSSNSDTALATQQSIKAYVDAQIVATNTLNISDDTSSEVSLDLDNTLQILGGNNITTAVSGDNKLTITGSKDININSITSDDSTAIQINDGLTVTGPTTLHNQVIFYDPITGFGRTLGSSTTLTANRTLNFPNANGTVIIEDADTGNTIIGGWTINGTTVSSNDSSLITINDNVDVIGTLTTPTIQTNNISSADSSAIQINDAVNVAGNINIVGTITATGDGTFEDVRVRGNLTVDGTQTILNTETLSIEDNIIVLNRNVSGTPAADAGIEINRGDEASKSLLWNESTDKWTVGSDTFVAGTFEGNLTGNVTGNADTATSMANVITVVGDDSTGTTLNSQETFKIAGNTNITTAVSGDTLTITGSKDININSITSDDSTAIQINDGLNVAGNIDVQGNTVTGLATPSANSDAATKAYVDTQVSANNSLTLGADDSSEITLNLDTTLNIKGGTGITTSVTGDTLTITGVNQAQGISFGDNTSSTISIPDGNTLNIVGTGGLVATVLGDTLTIDGSSVSADLGDFTFSGNKLSTTSSNADFEIDTAGTGNVVMSNSTALILPSGTTVERPATATTGMIRFNTETVKYEVSEDGAIWIPIVTGAEKPNDNIAHSTKEYNKLTTSSTVIDEFDQFEYSGVFYHIAIEDISNNLVGHVNINVVRNDIGTFHVVYDKNEDSSNLVNWSTNLNVNYVQLIAQANAESSHINLKIQRINVGYYEGNHTLTNGKTVRTGNVSSVQKVIDNFDATAHQSVKYYAVFKDTINGEFEAKELLVTHDNTNAYITGYGNVSTTGNSLIEYSATISNYNVLISAQTNGGTGDIMMYRMDLGVKTHLGTYNNINYRLLGVVDATQIMTVDSFEVTSRRSAKYLVSLYNSDSTTSQLSEISVIHDGSTASFSEVSIDSGSTIGNFSTDISGSKVRLRFQGSGYNSTKIIFARFDYETPLFYKANADTTGSIYASGSGALHLPSGTTAQRPSPTPGVIRFNTTTSQYEVSVDGSSWQSLKTQSYTRTVTKDVFAGDGSTQTFTSANVATDAENLLVYIDGVIQEPDINYTINIPASTITITDEAPHSGARVVVIRGFAEDVALS
jgi:hypothetical protein